MSYKVKFDGASKGNPGPASFGAIMYKDGERCTSAKMYIGETTNNVAEYCGFISAITLALRREGEMENLRIEGDSRLVLNQVLGTWKCNSEILQPYNKRAKELVKRLKVPYTWSWIPRAENSEADALANAALITF